MKRMDGVMLGLASFAVWGLAGCGSDAEPLGAESVFLAEAEGMFSIDFERLEKGSAAPVSWFEQLLPGFAMIETDLGLREGSVLRMSGCIYGLQRGISQPLALRYAVAWETEEEVTDSSIRRARDILIREHDAPSIPEGAESQSIAGHTIHGWPNPGNGPQPFVTALPMDEVRTLVLAGDRVTLTHILSGESRAHAQPLPGAPRQYGELPAAWAMLDLPTGIRQQYADLAALTEIRPRRGLETLALWVDEDGEAHGRMTFERAQEAEAAGAFWTAWLGEGSMEGFELASSQVEGTAFQLRLAPRS